MPTFLGRALPVFAATVFGFSVMACGGSTHNPSVDGEVAATVEAAPVDEEVAVPSPKPSAQDGGAGEDAAPDADEGDAAADATPLPDAGDAGDADATSDAMPDATPDAAPPLECFDQHLGMTRPVIFPAPGEIAIGEWMPDPTAAADSVGEWVELVVFNAVDLNGLRFGSASWGAPVASASCLFVAGGSRVIFARGTDGSTNGLGAVPVLASLPATLPNASGTLAIAANGFELDRVTWSASAAGRSIAIDGVGKQCVTGASAATYNGSDRGTPGAANAACP